MVLRTQFKLRYAAILTMYRIVTDTSFLCGMPRAI